MITQVLLVGIGGAIGAIIRFAITHYKFQSSFPFQTFIVNIVGSFAIGLCIALLKNAKIDSNTYLFLATGICGGFTTFSAFSAENISLLQNDKMLLFFLYAVGSVTLGLLATYLGYKMASTV